MHVIEEIKIKYASSQKFTDATFILEKSNDDKRIIFIKYF